MAILSGIESCLPCNTLFDETMKPVSRKKSVYDKTYIMTVIPLKKKAISASPCSVVRKTLIDAGARTRQIWRSRLLGSRPFNLRSHLSSWTWASFLGFFLESRDRGTCLFWLLVLPCSTSNSYKHPKTSSDTPRRSPPYPRSAHIGADTCRITLSRDTTTQTFEKKPNNREFAPGPARCIS